MPLAGPNAAYLSPCSNGEPVTNGTWRKRWRRLLRNRAAVVASIILLGLHTASLCAGFLAPYAETHSDRNRFHHPPTRIHWTTDEGHLTWPYVHIYRQTASTSAVFSEDSTGDKYRVHFFVHGEPYRLFGCIPTNIRLFGVEHPAVVYLLGADRLGRDIFSRLLYGGCRSLFIGVVGVLISSICGLVYGGVAGYYGGKIDNLAMRGAEALLSVPSMYLLIALGALLPTSLAPEIRYLCLTILLSLVGWAGISRVVRGMVLSIRKQEYVVASLALGANTAHVLCRHVLPGTFSYMIVNMTIRLPGYILSESSLSFLGLGIQEPVASWGNMLSDATNMMAVTQYPWMLTPGLAISLAVLCWSFVGDGLQAVLDPRSDR